MTYTKLDTEKMLMRHLNDYKQSEFSKDEIFDIGRDFGFSEEEINLRYSQYTTKLEKDILSDRISNKLRKDFFLHLALFTTINAILFFADHLTTPGLQWSHYLLIGWSTILAYHFYDSFFPSNRNFEKKIKNFSTKNKN